jgi:hypothetical protein
VRRPAPRFYVRHDDPAGVRWKETASFVVELGPNFPPLRVYRLRGNDTYSLVRYFAEHELKRLFRPAKERKR